MKKKYPLTMAAISCLIFSALFTAARAQAPATSSVQVISTIHPVTDILRDGGAEHELSRTPAPGTTPMVFINGLLMCAGEDYNPIVGKQLTFTGAQLSDSPVIQIQYWSAEP